MDKLKIISFNAQGLKLKNKRSKVLNWTNRKKFDIMAIQESHFEDEDMAKWKEGWKGEIISSSGSNNSRGVTFLITESLVYNLKDHYKDSEGRWVILDIEVLNSNYTIANYYGPNDDNPECISKMLQKIDELNNLNRIVCGDFNFVMDLKMDKLNGRQHTNFKCRTKTTEWMEENNMQDIWRIKHPKEKKYTWTSHHTPPIMCRLDFFLLSDNLNGAYKDSNIVPGFRSDHSCVTLNLESTNDKRGRGFWKFNSNLLQNKNFKE